MCVCMYVCVCVCIFYYCVHEFAHLQACMRARTHGQNCTVVCIKMFVFVCSFECARTRVCLSVFVCACMYERHLRLCMHGFMLETQFLLIAMLVFVGACLFVCVCLCVCACI